MASGRPDGVALVFPARDGQVWSEHTYRNWRRRVFKPTARHVGADTMRPYDLRHAFCSLLIHEGQTAVEVAEQIGNAPTMTYDTYSHVMKEAKGGKRLSAEAAIRVARGQQVSEKSPPAADEAVGGTGNPL
jgi:integrase